MRVLNTALISLLMMGPAAVPAEEIKNVEPIVVTATKYETPAEQLGATVSVVTDEDFKTYHYLTVEDALRSVPGLDVRRSGSLGKAATLSIRGANANQVQVLIDGSRVKSPTLGLADFSDISTDLIERIEVLRGPQSALYGADAIGGVINIITKKGHGPFSATVEQEAGNYDTLGSRASFSGSYRLLDYSFSASHLESNGRFPNDGTDRNAISGRLGVSLPLSSSIAFILRYNRADTGVPIRGVFPRQPIDPVLDINARQQSDTTVMTLTGRTRPVSWWESEVRLSRYENSQGFQDPPDPGFPFDVLTVNQVNVERREAEWVNRFHAGRWSTSSVGLEHRDEEGDVRGSFSKRTDTQSAFFEEQLRFFERLFLTGGVRVEDHSVFGTEATERGSVAYLIKETGTKLRGSAGSGFRAPTFNELFFPGFGDAAIRPERSVSYDVGADQKLWENRIRLGLTYFHNEFENLIKCCGPATTAAPFGTVINVGRSRSAGIEFTSEADLLDNLLARVNYTYTDSEDLATHRPLPREPFRRWNIGLTWDPVRRLSLFTEVHSVSRQFETLGEVFNSGHTLVNVGGTYRLFERYAWLQALDLTARIQNLLDEGYAEVRGFPALGTNFLFGLKAAF